MTRTDRLLCAVAMCSALCFCSLTASTLAPPSANSLIIFDEPCFAAKWMGLVHFLMLSDSSLGATLWLRDSVFEFELSVKSFESEKGTPSAFEPFSSSFRTMSVCPPTHAACSGVWSSFDVWKNCNFIGLSLLCLWDASDQSCPGPAHWFRTGPRHDPHVAREVFLRFPTYLVFRIYVVITRNLYYLEK